MEGKFDQGKNDCGLKYILAKRADSSTAWSNATSMSEFNRLVCGIDSIETGEMKGEQVNDRVSLTCLTFLLYQTFFERMLMALNFHYCLLSNNAVSCSGRVLSVPE